MNKNRLFLLCLTVVMTLACCGMCAASQWDGCYCTSGACGVNAYNFNYGYYTGYSCTPNYVAPFQAEFIRDVTYVDGAYVAPGTSFVKTWRVKNVGTQAWTTDMSLVFTSGDQMGAPAAVKIPCYVAPGQTVDLSVTMVAPTYAASVTGQWMLRAVDGTLFGVGCNGQTPLWVTINTWTYTNCTCYGQANCNCSACTTSACASSSSGYRSGRNPFCNNKIREVKDVTIPDGTVVAPGATFRKTWRMKNGGTCIWDANYVLVKVAGDDLGGAEYVSVTAAKEPQLKYPVNRPATKILPGEYIEISIDLKAPTTPGTYEAYYRLRDNMGYEFGFGPYADEAFWVNIVVSSSAGKAADESEGDTGTIAKDVDPALVEGVPEAEVEIVEPTVSDANLCGEQSIILRGTETGYDVVWTAVNAGTATWDSYMLIKANSNPAVSLANDMVPVPLTAPGETAEVSFGINIDDSLVGDDPLFLDFYVDSGSESFCQFSFEAPKK